MSKTFRPYGPYQDFLMPASRRGWLPSDHPAYFISDVVDQLDLPGIMERFAGEERGYPPYHPAMMVKVLFYACCTGVASSRKIEKRLCEDVAFRILAANHRPQSTQIIQSTYSGAIWPGSTGRRVRTVAPGAYAFFGFTICNS